jgi:hypothetical protein
MHLQIRFPRPAAVATSFFAVLQKGFAYLQSPSLTPSIVQLPGSSAVTSEVSFALGAIFADLQIQVLPAG